MLTPSAGLSWGNHAAQSPHLCRYHPFPVHSFGETGSGAFMADWSLPSRSGGSNTLLLGTCNGYLAHPFKKVAPWAFTARLFLVVKWDFAIEIAGEKFSWTRQTTRVWAADHDDWSAKVAGEGCKRPLEA